jgi:hypothetical protein
MSLEQAIEKLTAAVEANTAVLKGAGAGSGKSSSTSSGNKDSGYTAKHDKAAMQTTLNEVKEKHGTPAAKALIKEVGGADKMADITDPKKIDEVTEAAKKKLAEEEGM